MPPPSPAHDPQGHIAPAAEFGNDDQTTNSFPLSDLEFMGGSPGHIICGDDPMVPIM